MVKLIMTWNIRDGKEQEYMGFLTREFTKSLLNMGIQPSDAWYAMWGKGPQVLAGGEADARETMEAILASDEWNEFQEKLQELVVDFQSKVVEAKGGFQL